MAERVGFEPTDPFESHALRACALNRATRPLLNLLSGGRRIRTSESLAALTLFESARFNHSRIPPKITQEIYNWRRARDSNPQSLSGQRFSRPPDYQLSQPSNFKSYHYYILLSIIRGFFRRVGRI